ncbi:histone deacetylase [Aquisalimonas lutea]|uniref:histone deacetylase family protein n=1 Tax=Aquisalimonas lutea TaxID=1327750 RepID=UPI00338D89D9|nr:histone deacetylase [Aquisalimonas lutea]
MGLPFIHHPGYTIELPAAHPFPMRKFTALREQLCPLAAGAAIDWLQPEPVDRDALRRVHTRDYIEAFFGGRVDRIAQRRSGFQWSEELVSRVRLETAGTLLTVEAALAEGLALNTAGGTHHAHADTASGYCLINDIAVAAAHALARGWVRRVLVVDLDVHQGDGTAALFQDVPEVFTFSMHAGTNFPARKQHGDLDVALPKGMADDTYLDALAARLPELLEQFRPDVVIYDAGVDVHERDRLGHLALTDAGIRQRDEYVIRACRSAGVPVAAVIGGGYDRDIEALAARHALLHQAAINHWNQAGG